jgi:hypothetical protein
VSPRARFAAAALLASGLGSAVGVASPAPKAAPATPPCAGVSPPQRLTKPPVNLPASFVSARLGGVVVDEAVIGADGTVSDVRLVHTRIENLAPFGQKSVQDSRFLGGSVDGHPAALRVRVATPVGTVTPVRVEPEYDSIWAYVAGGQSREAVWQLARSVAKVTLEIHLGTSPEAGSEIVARAPDGKEHVLKKVSGASAPIDRRETVSTGKFLEAPGDYRIELRAAGRTLASTTMTIADDYTRAIVNACEPL